MKGLQSYSYLEDIEVIDKLTYETQTLEHSVGSSSEVNCKLSETIIALRLCSGYLDVWFCAGVPSEPDRPGDPGSKRTTHCSALRASWWPDYPDTEWPTVTTATGCPCSCK